VQFWKDRAAHLRHLEDQARDRTHADVLRVVSGKKIELFHEMLVAADFPDARRAADAMREGFAVVGEVPPTGVFPPFRRPAQSTPERLVDNVGAARRSLASVSGSGDASLDLAVYESTLEEVSSGWLRGPFEAKELDAKYEWWLYSRRFGILQGGKLRVIDDYSASGHNEATGSCEKIDVGDVDSLVGIARAMMLVGSIGDNEVCMPGLDGTALRGSRHRDFCKRVGFKGKLWDLSKAYRQLPRHPSQAHIAIAAVFNPLRGVAELFEQTALPFGATAVVYYF